MIGLGIVTCGRPVAYAALLESVEKQLGGVVDVVCAHEDGSPIYGYSDTGGDATNRGVAVAKNHVLRTMLGAGCDWLIVAEDDMTVTDPQAVTGYVDACERSGWHHLMFHLHGDGNRTAPLRSHGCITEWPNYVGSWCIYSRECLERCGLFDEGFRNAWEHVEHTLRLSEHGYTPPWRGAADATGSERWLVEQPNVDSVIRPRDDWQSNIIEGREYWARAHPSTFRMVFG